VVSPPPPPEGAAASSARKQGVVDAVGDFDVAVVQQADGTVVRTLVVMGGVATAAVRSLGMPLFLLIALGLMVATMGNISIFPLLRRSRRMTGTVARFDRESGYGFILSDTGDSEVFVHGQTLRRRVHDLHPGERVSFRVIRGSHRDFALAVRRIET
jgi:cold shock CspA family protein